jgi:putative N6-adenine-specific DNA methylase
MTFVMLPFTYLLQDRKGALNNCRLSIFMDQFFATVASGLETLAAQELDTLGAQDVEPGFCGVAFRGDRALLYRVNLWARLPFRILIQLDEFKCKDKTDLYRGIYNIEWGDYLRPHHTFAVHATGKTQTLNHTHFTALQVKQAIVDQQEHQWQERSNIDTQAPDVAINVHLHQNRCVVSLDSSGESLHRRGYRPAVGAAPLKESLAAALIAWSGWQPDQAFLDPLCGSGTLPLEACLRALNLAPGLFRERFGFETWPNFDADLFNQLYQDAESVERSQLLAPIVGSDRDPDQIHQALTNASFCGVSEQVEFCKRELAEVEPPAPSGVLICNPPYGSRLTSDGELGEFYRLLGNVLKQRFKGWTAFILSGNKALATSIGLKSSQRLSVANGGIPCQVLKYELY